MSDLLDFLADWWVPAAIVLGAGLLLCSGCHCEVSISSKPTETRR